MNITRTLASTVAAAAVTLAAGAATAQAAVAPGVIEHRVYDVRSALPQDGIPSHIRVEHFVAQDRDRAVVTDAQSGELVAETVKNGTSLNDFFAPTNTLTTGKALPGVNFTQSRADDAANMERLLGDGTFVVEGETTWNGRAAVIAKSVKLVPGQLHTKVVIDAATKQTLQSTSAAGEPAYERTLVLDEDLPATPENEAKLRMLEHPNAKVVALASKRSKSSRGSRANRAAQKAAAKRRAAVRKVTIG